MIGTPSRTQDRAASSVTGVVLAVGLVVVLGTSVSVIGLDIAGQLGPAPPFATFEYTTGAETVTVTLTQTDGDALDGEQLRFAGAALEKTTFGGITEWADGTVVSGQSATVNVTAASTLRIVWRADSGGRTATIGAFEVPASVGPYASIGSVDTGGWPPPWQDGEVVVKNIQFARVENDRVYVVVEDEPKVGPGDGTSTGQYVSTNGGDLSVDLIDSYIHEAETITVTVFETSSRSNVLATATGSA